jgi:hypothetical protein
LLYSTLLGPLEKPQRVAPVFAIWLRRRIAQAVAIFVPPKHELFSVRWPPESL